MSQARHVGKVVLTLPAGARSEGTVLITGGTGVLGCCWRGIWWSRTGCAAGAGEPAGP